MNQEMINLPWFLDLRIYFDDEKLDLENCNFQDYYRYLNFKDATLNRSFTWLTACGSEVGISFERFISLDQKSLSVQRLRLKVHKGRGMLRVESGINTKVRTNGYNHFRNITTGTIGDNYIFTEVETDGNNHVYEVSSINSFTKIGFEIKEDQDRKFFYGEQKLMSGEDLEIIKLTCITTDRDLETDNYCVRALKILNVVQTWSYDQLIRNIKIFGIGNGNVVM